MKKELAYLSLGGNQGNVLARLKLALVLLTKQNKISSLRFSHFYQTSPVEVISADWFVNLVCSFYTSFSLKELFATTQYIEKQLGKKDKPKNASRPIDIDILFYGQTNKYEADLEIPHPRWKERLFILIPLLDLTQTIAIHYNTSGICEYSIQNLIACVSAHSNQTISILEKNPHIP